MHCVSLCVFRSTVHQDTCNAVGTQGYPTLRYFEPPAEGAEAESAKGTKGENYAGKQPSGFDDACHVVWFTL